MSRLIFSVFIYIFTGIQYAYTGSPKFVLPPTSPTRHELVSGLGVPLNLENEAITYGWAMKAQYFIPETIDQLKFEFFPGIFENYTSTFMFDKVWQRFPNGRKRREILIDPLTGSKYEKYDGIVDEKANIPLDDASTNDNMDEFDDQFEEDILERKLLRHEEAIRDKIELKSDKINGIDASPSRWFIYDAFKATLEKSGFNGHMCILRAICEASFVRFNRNNLIGELFHIFLTPSTTSEAVRMSRDYDYIKAEMVGQEVDHEEACGKKFNQCKISIIDLISQVFTVVN